MSINVHIQDGISCCLLTHPASDPVHVYVSAKLGVSSLQSGTNYRRTLVLGMVGLCARLWAEVADCALYHPIHHGTSLDPGVIAVCLRCPFHVSAGPRPASMTEPANLGSPGVASTGHRTGPPILVIDQVTDEECDGP
jgi:hypothetical protein